MGYSCSAMRVRRGMIFNIHYECRLVGCEQFCSTLHHSLIVQLRRSIEVNVACQGQRETCLMSLSWKIKAILSINLGTKYSFEYLSAIIKSWEKKTVCSAFGDSRNLETTSRWNTKCQLELCVVWYCKHSHWAVVQLKIEYCIWFMVYVHVLLWTDCYFYLFLSLCQRTNHITKHFRVLGLIHARPALANYCTCSTHF